MRELITQAKDGFSGIVLNLDANLDDCWTDQSDQPIFYRGQGKAVISDLTSIDSICKSGRIEFISMNVSIKVM